MSATKKQYHMDHYSNYAEAYESVQMMYPAEDVIRIFKGDYPQLCLPKEEYEGSRILDVGCGDGRHLVFCSNDLGFDAYGVEPTEELTEIAGSNVSAAGVDANIRAGTNQDLPFEDDKFDYLLSWNSCYYMEEGHQFDFQEHVQEYARVVKPNGRIILSIPKASCFIYEHSVEAIEGYRIIKEDPFATRDGVILRQFDNDGEIVEAFSPQFRDFTIASIHDDFFGYNYHWWLMVGTRNIDH